VADAGIEPARHAEHEVHVLRERQQALALQPARVGEVAQSKISSSGRTP